jgi:signal transduction histidine kinase
LKTPLILLLLLWGLYNPEVYGQSANEKLTEIRKIPNKQEQSNKYVEFLRSRPYTSPDSTLVVIDEAEKLAKSLSDKNALATLYQMKGIQLNNLGEPHKAVEVLNESISLLEELGKFSAQADVISSLGTIIADLGNNVEATSLFIQSLKIKEEVQDTLGILLGYLRLGVIYDRQGQTEDALLSYTKALELSELTGNLINQKSALVNIGIMHGKTGDNLKAIEYFEAAKAIQVDVNFGTLTIDFNIFNNLGVAYFNLNRLEEAEINLKAGEAILKDINYLIGKARNAINFGNLYTVKNNLSLAEEYYLAAIKLTDQLDAYVVMKEAYTGISDLYEKMGRFEPAYRYSQKIIGLNDSLFNIERTKIINDLKIQYELDKKENELVLLNRINSNRTFQRNLFALVIFIGFAFMLVLYYGYITIQKANKILKDQKEKLALSNQMKDKLFSIIGHDLRGPFQGLLGGLQLMRSDAFDSKEELAEFIDKLIISAESAHQILEDLLIWGKASSFESRPANHKLESMVHDATKLYEEQIGCKKLKISRSFEGAPEVFADYQEVEFVIRNLIHNAIKFSPVGGEIQLSAHSDGEKSCLQIKDNGVGISRKSLDNLFSLNTVVSALGTSNEKGTGLGLIVSRELIEKNSGTIDVESEPGKGSIFTICLPAKKPA